MAFSLITGNNSDHWQQLLSAFDRLDAGLGNLAADQRSQRVESAGFELASVTGQQAPVGNAMDRKNWPSLTAMISKFRDPGEEWEIEHLAGLAHLEYPNLHATFEPGATREQNSYARNVWLITDENDQPLGYFVVAQDDSHAVIPN